MIEQIRRARSELAAICLRHNVRSLDLFGSAVGTSFDPATSDLDFLVEFGPFPKGGYSEHYFGLIEDLTALFGRPVDLLVARAVRNPYLLESINQTRESLYAAA
jgi:predicted nucleotidyltransferase